MQQNKNNKYNQYYHYPNRRQDPEPGPFNNVAKFQYNECNCQKPNKSNSMRCRGVAIVVVRFHNLNQIF